MVSILVWTDQEYHSHHLALHCPVWPRHTWVILLWALHCLFAFSSLLHLGWGRGSTQFYPVGWGWLVDPRSAASPPCSVGPPFRSPGSPGRIFPPPSPSPALSLRLLLLFTFLRIGEARVPGPRLADTHLDDDLLWLISANSTGIAHKSSMILQPGVTWLIQESHLTVRGLDHFRKELKATTRIQASTSRIHSLAGHPVEPRRSGTLLASMRESLPSALIP